MDNNTEKSNCVCEVLKSIDEIQKKVICKNKQIEDCTYYGTRKENPYSYDTRPIILYCGNGSYLEVNIDDLSDETTYIFRVEKVDDCCATLRALRIIDDNEANNYSLVSTNKFITVQTNCFCAIRCLNDININENIIITEYQLYKNNILIDSGSFPFGTHFFEAIDSNNEEPNPNYRIEIKFYNLPNSSILKLVNGVAVNNPQFIINNYELVNNNAYALLTIDFTVQTGLVAAEYISLALLENTEQQGLFTFSIVNDDGLIIDFAFLMTVITIYP